jgi:hypothetical protein
MPSDQKLQEPVLRMFEPPPQESSWMDFPGKFLKLLISPFIVVATILLTVLFLVPQIAIGIAKLPIILRKRRIRRDRQRIELQREGRFITYEVFIQHTANNEGLAIRDMEGFVWWAKEVPASLNPGDLKQRGGQRIVDLFSLHRTGRLRDGEKSFDEISKLSYASLVVLDKGKVPRSQWEALGRESDMAMLALWPNK